MNTYNRPATNLLNATELKLALRAVEAAEPGLYTVKQLFALIDVSIPRPQRFGKSFKATVVASQLPGLRWAGRRSNKSQLYEVMLRPAVRTQRLKGGMMAVRGVVPRASRQPLLPG